MVRPTALVKSPLPSASIITLSSTFWSLPQASMTKASLTERQAMASTPLALIAWKLFTKPGTCLAEQVGVKAPGSANSATFLPEKKSSVFTGVGLPSCISIRVAEGILSPTLIVMNVSVLKRSADFGCGCGVIMPCDVIQCPGGVERGRKIIALAEFAADFGQELGVGLAFHALCHHRALELMGHGDNARQHHLAISTDIGACKPGQEASVDLHRVHRQVAEFT